MSSAPAEVAGKATLDLLFGRVPIRSEQRGGGHDHAIRAVAALGRLFPNERCLDCVGRLRRSEPFKRRDAAAGDLLHGCDARSDSLSIEQNRTGAALAEAASEFRSVQSEAVPQHVKQRLVGVPGLDC
jgi:hypothetical protein